MKIAAEGVVDVAVARRLLAHFGLRSGYQVSTRGKGNLDPHIGRYRAAASLGDRWLVLRDLDRDAGCAPELLARLNASDPVSGFCLRIAVRSIEAWFLADAEGLAAALKVSSKRIPDDPDRIANPKRCLVDLARHSSSPTIKRQIVPKDGTSVEAGPEYVAWALAFVQEGWHLDAAVTSARSPSLTSAASRIRWTFAPSVR